MVNVTLVRFEKVCSHDNMTREFRVESRGKIKTIKVRSYSHGWATIQPDPICYIEDLAELVEGCFLNGSNFPREVMKAFEYNSVFEGVEFEFNGVTIKVNHKNFKKEEIMKAYWKGVKKRKKV